MTTLAESYAAVGAAVHDAATVVAVGTGTHADIGGAVSGAEAVRAPSGIVDVQPANMTVTVRAGTSCSELSAALAEVGQECPLDPREDAATIGGTLAAGLSGPRRLGVGPLRETVLEVVLVRADGHVVRGGGPTVKNVTGYDVPRLVVGSLGTLGVITQVTLRTRPIPPASEWFTSERPVSELRTGLFAPTAVVTTRTGTSVWLEGHPGDIAAQAARAGLAPTPPVTPPAGVHRGRISVAPGHVDTLTRALDGVEGIEWMAEQGVGTVHVASDTVGPIATARELAHTQYGWLLREAGAAELDPFGVDLPHRRALQRRIRVALDPTGKLAPGRVPATEPVRTPA